MRCSGLRKSTNSSKSSPSASSRSAEERRELQTRLGYEFTDPTLIDRALTHKSFSAVHNERLEFLGDAVLGFAVADWLYVNRPEFAEDALTLLRASLVKKATLAAIARELNLGDYLRLGQGERKSGGRERASILADALEAIIGAIHRDGGISAATEFVHRIMATRAERLDPTLEKDSKSTLQERTQGAGIALPVYAVVRESGADHARVFEVTCRIVDLDLEVRAAGSSRRAAEKAAAEVMLGELDRCQKI